MLDAQRRQLQRRVGPRFGFADHDLMCGLWCRQTIGIVEIEIDIVADQVIGWYIEVLPDLDNKIQCWATFAIFKIVDVGMGVGIAQFTRKRTKGEPALGP